MCTVCNNLIHKSCSERRNFTVISKNLIWCSEKCAEDAVKLEENFANTIKHYEDTIKKLQKEIEEKDRYTQRLKTLNMDLEQEMLEFDHKSEQKIQEQNSVINELKSEMQQTLEESLNISKNTPKSFVDSSTQTTYLSQESTTKTQPATVQTESKLNTSFSTQTEDLQVQQGSTQTELSEQEMEEVRLVNALLRINVTKSTQTSMSPVALPGKCAEPNPPNKKQNNTQHKSIEGIETSKPQLFLLTNSPARGLSMKFKELTNHTFDINMQYIYKGSFDDLVVHAENYIHKLKAQDALVIFVGPVNAITAKGISLEKLQRLITNARQTNVFICACPLSQNRPILNKFIRKINSDIKQATADSNITYIETPRLISPQIITSTIYWEHYWLNNLITHICQQLQSALNENKDFATRLHKLRQNTSYRQTPQKNKNKINIIKNITIRSAIKNVHSTSALMASATQQTQISPITPKHCFFRSTKHKDAGWHCSTQG